MKKINPKIGCTDAHLRSQIRSALRKTWRNSSRRVFIESVRFPYKGKSGRGKWGVKCEECEKVMGVSERFHPTLKSGKKAKRKTLAYQIDHLEGNPPFLDIRKDLGEYAYSLLYGDCRVLCYDCHAKRTAEQ